MGKIVKARNWKKFKEDIFPLITKEYSVKEFPPPKSYFKVYDTYFGDLQIYPKSNKVLICKDSEWINQGMEWLLDSVINNQSMHQDNTVTLTKVALKKIIQNICDDYLIRNIDIEESLQKHINSL